MVRNENEIAKRIEKIGEKKKNRSEGAVFLMIFLKNAEKGG